MVSSPTSNRCLTADSARALWIRKIVVKPNDGIVAESVLIKFRRHFICDPVLDQRFRLTLHHRDVGLQSLRGFPALRDAGYGRRGPQSRERGLCRAQPGAVEVGVSPHAQGQVVASRCSKRSNSGSVISSLASAAASSRRAAL